MTVTWNAQNAAHLLRRTGFGATISQIKSATKSGMAKSVAKILKTPKINDKIPPDVKSIEDLQAWWVNLMLDTPAPLIERLVLFWHNHFATGHSKVGDFVYMHRQNTIFRKHAMGSFREMVTNVSRDPAMLIWLDNNTNVKGKQNQNFARELMELFTTGVNDKNGIANYTETDVDEAAKAFTGWTVKDGIFFFNESKHDFGTKTFKGITGNLDGTDIINLLVVQPATAHRVARQLFSYFAYDIPLDDPFIAELANIYLANDTAIKPVLQRIFTSDQFYSDASKNAGVKEPAVYLVSAFRPLKMKLQTIYINKEEDESVSNTYALSNRLDQLGQSLFDPPTVFGWDYGLAWVTASGLLERAKVADWISEARDPTQLLQYKPETILGPSYKKLTAQIAAERILQNFGIQSPALATLGAIANYLMVDNAGNPVAIVWDEDTIDKKVRGAIALVLSSAEFQAT
ncbi:MAG: DUF1800 family protein [Planctomycetota bacterium]